MARRAIPWVHSLGAPRRGVRLGKGDSYVERVKTGTYHPSRRESISVPGKDGRPSRAPRRPGPGRGWSGPLRVDGVGVRTPSAPVTGRQTSSARATGGPAREPRVGTLEYGARHVARSGGILTSNARTQGTPGRTGLRSPGSAHRSPESRVRSPELLITSRHMPASAFKRAWPG